MTEPTLKRFWVTFKLGGLFRGYHQAIDAYDEDIVRAWLNRECRGQWSNIYDHEPTGSKPLREKPEQLFHSKAEHV